MEQYRISRKQSSIVLLASLIVHLGIIIIMFRQGVDNWTQKIIPFTEHAQDEYIVEQILCAGQQPTTVLFQDEPSSGHKNNPQHDMTEAPQEIEQATPEQAHEACEHELFADTQDQEELITLQDPEQELHEHEPEPTAQPEDGTHMVTEKPTEQTKPRRRKKTDQRKRTVNKQNITLADISRGFMKSIQQEAGYNNATRDMRQLALQVYASKIWNLIKNSFLARESCLHLPRAVSAHTQLIVTIDRSGTLMDINLAYPKHITELRHIEQLLVSSAQQAGLFPPLPEQIKGETKRFSFPLHIEAEEGFHSYALSYR